MNNTNTTFIIEDNPGDLILLKTQLQTAGWPAVNSQNESLLTNAVESLKKIKPVVVFLDLNLPDSNGLETFLTIQAIVPDVPIIILSGMNDTSLSLQAVQAGAQDFLVKGEFEEKLLLKTILYSIERKKSQLKLDEVNKRYRYASKATNDPLWDWDIKSNEILWNEKVKIFGYHDAVSKNDSWRMNNIHPEDKERIITKLNKLLYNSAEQWNEEYRFRCSDGGYKYIYDRGYVLRDRNKQAYRMIGTMQDVTGQIIMQKKLEEEKEQQQKAILKTAIESQEKERNEIGKELHDNVNQILAAANIYLGRIKPGDEIKTLEMVKESRNLISKAVEEIRNLTHKIVTSHINEIGLVETIKNIVHEINALQIFHINFTSNINDNNIDPNIILTVYRIIQEQISNIIKHAEATNVYISLEISQQILSLIINDNGKGADISKVKNGIGLSNIKTRTTTYNGTVKFETAAGKGFTVTVTFASYKPVTEHY
jgi:two-component system, NarL family, sensor histidine kinase UhpB